MQKAEQGKKWPAWAGWLAGYIGVLAGSVGLVYFWRVIFSLGEIPLVRFSLGVAAVATVVYLLFFAVHRLAKDNICLKATLCVLVVGLLFVFAAAPLQSPDEEKHYLRAYSISQGHFNYDDAREYPNDVNWLVSSILTDNPSQPGDYSYAYNFGITYRDGDLATSALAAYRAGVASSEAAPVTVTEPIMFMLWPYLLQAAAMAVARLFGFSALGLLYAARIANLLVYTAICYKVFKNCDKFRGVFIGLALLPLSLSLAASCSYDCIMLALCYLAISYFCKAEIKNKDVLLFVAAVALATVLKPNNFVLAAVLLLVPKARWKTSFNPWLFAGGAAVLGILLYFGLGAFNNTLTVGFESLPRGSGEEASVMGQVWFILKSPFAFVSRMLFTVWEQDGYLFNLGTFGQMDLTLPMVGGLSVLVLCAASALGIQQREDTKATGAVGILLAALLYGASILAAMYVLDTDVGSIRATGVQPRYFLPAFLLLFMLASILLGKAVRPRLSACAMVRTQNVTLYIALAVALFTVILLFQSYYIGQWMEKADGGYKMINLLGNRIY